MMLNDEDLKFVIKNVKDRLKTLSIVIGSSIKSIIHCTKIEKLSIKGEPRLIISTNFVSYVCSLKNLTSLELCNCVIELIPGSIKNILNQYINMLKVLQLLDPQGIIF